MTATDTLLRKGLYPPKRVTPPFVIGHDFVGTVEAVGDGVSGRAVGQRVGGLVQAGGNAEHVIVSIEDTFMAPSDRDAALVSALSLSWVCARQMLRRIDEAKRVLVHGGSGAVGHALVQLARADGAEVVTTCRGRKRSALQADGVDALAYDDPGHGGSLQAAGPFDAVFDALGPASAWRSFRALRPGGALVVFGTHRVGRRLSRRTLASFLRIGLQFGGLMASLRLMQLLPGGRRASFYGVYDALRADPTAFEADLAALADLAEAGRIRPRVEVLELRDAMEAHRRLERGEVVGQLVLRAG